MTPGKLNLVCPQGATFSKRLQLFDSADAAINLAGYTAAMQARQGYAGKTPLFSLSTAVGGGLTIVDNYIYITISSAVTAAFKPGEYVYDLEITNGGVTDRLLEGKFTVTPEVTR